MSARKDPSPTLSLASALEHSEPLSLLLRRLHDARSRFAAIRGELPEPLRDDVRPGPVDADVWTLLAEHNAAAAKLRQLVPTLQLRLQAAGWQGTSIKVRVQPRTRGP